MLIQNSKKLILALWLALMVSACDKYDELSLNVAAINYRQTCFASLTNECVAKRARLNIKAANFYLNKIKGSRAELTEAYSKEVYEGLVNMLNGYIKVNKDDMPGFFARNFMGETQIWSPTRISEWDLTPDVVGSWLNQLAAYDERQRDTKSPDILDNRDQIVPASMEFITLDSDAAEEKRSTSSSSADELDIESLVSSYIKSLESFENGYEYTDARESLVDDSKSNQKSDIAVLFTMEGAEGSNGYYRHLAVFLNRMNEYKLLDSIYVPTNSSLESFNQGILTLQVLEYADTDANCCPSVERKQQYMISEAGIFEKR